MASQRDGRLYPNRGDSAGAPDGLSRRQLLAGSAALGAAATAGCSGGEPAGEPTVFVFNTGDGTVSLIDAASDEVLDTVAVGLTASFPSNQYSPDLTDSASDPLWLNVGRGVRALEVGSLSEVARVGTGSGANWLERSPDGRHLVVSAREPAHRQFRIDADPDSDSFGTVTGEIDRTPEGGRGDSDGPGPCDVTIHPDGRYAYVPDLFGDTLTVLDVEAFAIATQVSVPAVGDGPASPWMATASWDGQWLLVEHNEGRAGTESVWDLSDPADPQLAGRLTAEDGLGRGPLTSEIGPDSETGYVFTPGSEDVTVIDLAAAEVRGRIDLGGEAFVGTWGPGRETLYVPVQTDDAVALIDHASGKVRTTLRVGAEPYGATAARARPGEAALSNLARPAQYLAAVAGATDTAYCLGRCGCGHQL